VPNQIAHESRLEDHTATSTAVEEWLTVDDVAAWLKVSKSWVYEHTRARGTPPTGRLPHIKLGKYVRFERRQVSAFLERRLTRS
jgi:excisionase family DNA binding protein